MTHYDDILLEARRNGETIANKYIFELYTILREEEHLPPEDCRAKIEHDCLDLWSKATIRKFLPEEAKNSKKSKAGKIRAEQKKELEDKPQKSKSRHIIEQNIDGSASTTISSRDFARTNLAENDSVFRKEQESRRFHAELNEQLGSRVLSPELIEAQKIISEKDQRIEKLENMILQQGGSSQIGLQLYLSNILAQQIHESVIINRSAGITETDFILRHDGNNVIGVESLSGIDPISKKNGLGQETNS